MSNVGNRQILPIDPKYWISIPYNHYLRIHFSCSFVCVPDAIDGFRFSSIFNAAYAAKSTVRFHLLIIIDCV